MDKGTGMDKINIILKAHHSVFKLILVTAGLQPISLSSSSEN